MKREEVERQVEVFFYRSRGPGGQRKNKKETAVRMVHVPTGVTVRATESRSQAANRERAVERLLEKLEKRERKKPPRIPTGKPPGVRLKEKKAKEKHSIRKRERKKPFEEEEF